MTEFIIIALISVVIILQILLLTKKHDQVNNQLQFDNLSKQVSTGFDSLNSALRQETTNNRTELGQAVEKMRHEVTTSIDRMLGLNQKANESLQNMVNGRLEGLTNTFTQSFADVRTAQTQALASFREEMQQTLKTIREENLTAVQKLTALVADGQKQLLESVQTADRLSREEQNKALKTFGESVQTLSEGLKKDVNLLITNFITQAQDQSNANRQVIKDRLEAFDKSFSENVRNFNHLQATKFEELSKSTERKLEEMRATVDEKLQKTLESRLSQSFEQVSKQLESVHKGLGEMQTLAQDVGGLKKVLSGVKTRGTFGEVQLEALIEQILPTGHFVKNFKVKSQVVEFAIKLPGQSDDKPVYLPLDAKFPQDKYERIVRAAEVGAKEEIDAAIKDLENAVKKMAKDISEKYIDIPTTTDFAILFLPTEGLYSEVYRIEGLVDSVWNNYKIQISGPSTFAALLNSLRVGFKTLTIQKQSSEVWQTLGVVKKEFEKFEDLLGKAHKKMQSATEDIDILRTTRTKAINKSLQKVQSLPAAEQSATLLMPVNDEVGESDA